MTAHKSGPPSFSLRSLGKAFPMTGCVVFSKVIEVPHHTQKRVNLSDSETPDLISGPFGPAKFVEPHRGGCDNGKIQSPILIKTTMFAL